ncbi:MAG TPA: hypothetical protein VF755_24360, partial [Catenuloplanes sp.]
GLLQARHNDLRTTTLASALFDQPTRGNLAGDRHYLDQVHAAWARHHDDRPEPADFVGGAHVVWAGSTPAGPAAFVAQRSPSIDGELAATVAFIEPTTVGPKVGPTDRFASADGSQPAHAALLGDKRDVLVVLDPGYPVSWSAAADYRPDGTVDRTFETVTFTAGAAVLTVPTQRDKVTVALRGATRWGSQPITISNAAEIKARPHGQVPAMSVVQRTLPGAEAVWPADAAAQTELNIWYKTALARYRDDAGDHRPSTQTAWWIRGRTPDGRRLWVQSEAIYQDPARVLAVLGAPGATPRVIYGGTVDPRQALAVRLRLPDRQGVVVAARDAVLSYRAGTGAWLPVAGDAALLPDAATMVRVIRGDKQPILVPLP